ncbi:hypothetical protein GCM10020256_35070 [Streptomyces thermocoprophilus]
MHGGSPRGAAAFGVPGPHAASRPAQNTAVRDTLALCLCTAHLVSPVDNNRAIMHLFERSGQGRGGPAGGGAAWTGSGRRGGGGWARMRA